VGVAVGAVVGLAVGAVVGLAVGAVVGDAVGAADGAAWEREKKSMSELRLATRLIGLHRRRRSRCLTRKHSCKDQMEVHRKNNSCVLPSVSSLGWELGSPRRTHTHAVTVIWQKRKRSGE